MFLCKNTLYDRIFERGMIKDGSPNTVKVDDKKQQCDCKKKLNDDTLYERIFERGMIKDGSPNTVKVDNKNQQCDVKKN